MKTALENLQLGLRLNAHVATTFANFFKRNAIWIIVWILCVISIISFMYFLDNGLALAYNDARSHLNIGRRVVEGLKPGLAQLGSVWLPLTHALMIPTIWNDFMWHTGLSGAIQSMISFVATGYLIYIFLKEFNVGLLGRVVGVAVFTFNLNVLYMQSTAMTELLLLVLMTAGVYELMLWHKNDDVLHLLKSSFLIMLSTLIRYDGWFLFAYSTGLVFLHTLRKRKYSTIEGNIILFCTLGGFGVFLWLLWNLLIFNDPLYFAFGPFSAHAQQSQLEQAGVLATKHNLPLSIKMYTYGMAYNSGAFVTLLSFVGMVILWFDKRIPLAIRFASTALVAPFMFNVLALYLGHSVLFIQGLSGNSWFNVRYGLMMMPSIAIFLGYLVDKSREFKHILIGLVAFSIIISIVNPDAVTIDDATIGSSQKNVSEVSGWLAENTAKEKEYILISAASHDAIVFSSGLPMVRYIHEGTGAYWDAATSTPDKWVRWIIMRTHDDNDLTWKNIKNKPGFKYYRLVESYPFADIYELKPEYHKNLRTDRPYYNN